VPLAARLASKNPSLGSPLKKPLLNHSGLEPPESLDALSFGPELRHRQFDLSSLAGQAGQFGPSHDLRQDLIQSSKDDNNRQNEVKHKTAEKRPRDCRKKSEHNNHRAEYTEYCAAQLQWGCLLSDSERFYFSDEFGNIFVHQRKELSGFLPRLYLCCGWWSRLWIKRGICTLTA
jgi:hypothetical protein